MITLTIVLIALVAVALAAIIGGAGLLALFGDLIVFGLILWVIIRLFRRRK